MMTKQEDSVLNNREFKVTVIKKPQYTRKLRNQFKELRNKINEQRKSFTKETKTIKNEPNKNSGVDDLNKGNESTREYWKQSRPDGTEN